MFHETGADLDETLAEEPELSFGLPPYVLELLVGLEVMARVEQLDPALERVAHVGMIDGI